MNTKKILVLGLFILFVVSLMEFIAASAAITGNSSLQYHGPLIIVGDGNLAISPVSYNGPVILDPGTAVTGKVLVWNSDEPLGGSSSLTMKITDVSSALTNPGYGPTTPNANDIASQTTALVWISSSQTETSPQKGDYYLTQNNGLKKINGNGDYSSLQLSDGFTTSGSGSITLPSSADSSTTAYAVYYTLTLSQYATANAQDQTLTVSSSLIGS